MQSRAYCFSWTCCPLWSCHWKYSQFPGCFDCLFWLLSFVLQYQAVWVILGWLFWVSVSPHWLDQSLLDHTKFYLYSLSCDHFLMEACFCNVKCLQDLCSFFFTLKCPTSQRYLLLHWLQGWANFGTEELVSFQLIGWDLNCSGHIPLKV